MAVETSDAKTLEHFLNGRRSDMWAALVLEISQQAEFQRLCGEANMSNPGAPRAAAEKIAAAIMVMDGPVFGFEVRDAIQKVFQK